MVTSVHTLESREHALRRLAQVARESGVKLMRDSDGNYWATSVSEPNWLYRLEPDRCGCRGFAAHRRCRHVAALWSALGYFDPEPEPGIANAIPDEPSTCPVCNGTGSECGTVPSGRTWRYGSIVCGSCHGRGSAVAA